MSATIGKRALSEGASKKLLADYGVPVAPGEVARSVEEAVALSEKFGYPVALKGHGEGLAHKTELGLVRLGIGGAEEARRVAGELFTTAPAAMDGVMVGPMLKGRREFVAGMFRDEVFGPVIMFGLGGVFAEALGDVVFRLAPMELSDARSMLDEIHGARLLGGFRGEAAADREALAVALCALSRLAADNPEIAEIDVNPLLVAPDGSVSAVDALVVMGEAAAEKPARRKIPTSELARFFHPKSIAIVGASVMLGKWGQRLPVNLLSGGYEGPTYLVNPKGGEMWGRPVYRDVGDIPGDVDMAVLTIPAHLVPAELGRLAKKGVRHVLLITSGFGETGEEGKLLEAEIVRLAAEHGMLLFGPNTMGIMNPHERLMLTGVSVRAAPGGTALVSQSGNMGVQLLEFARTQGVGIRAFAGSGNEAMVSVEDFMEGFEVDKVTTTVLLYLESVKDGRRFFESARRVGRKKPVIVLKGGRSEAGSRAAASHTGAMASNYRVFEAMCRQAGIVTVEKPVEMLDASAAFSSLPMPRGKRVAIMTLGGGWGVVTSDLCADRGLILEPLDDKLMSAFDGMLPSYWSRTNPIDLVGENDPELPLKALDLLGEWEGCDAIIHLGFYGRSHLMQASVEATAFVDHSVTKEQIELMRRMGEEMEKAYVEKVVATIERWKKPIIGVNLVTGTSERTLHEAAGSKYKAVLFNSPERAVTALYHMCRYSEFLKRS